MTTLTTPSSTLTEIARVRRRRVTFGDSESSTPAGANSKESRL